MTKIESRIEATFTVTISDDAPADIFTRGQDADWAGVFYGHMSQEDIIAHWAYNAAANGICDASSLDGWADVPLCAVRMCISNVEPQP